MKTLTAIILKQDGATEETEYAKADELATLQKAVGGYIQGVGQYGFGMNAYVNEEGLYTPGLTTNPHSARVLGVHLVGNIVLPRITPGKRARLAKRGFLSATSLPEGN